MYRCTHRDNNAQSTNDIILVCRITTERRLFITILFLLYHPAFARVIYIALK